MPAVKKGMSSFLRMEPNIRGNGKIASDMGRVFKSGLMELSIKDAGKIIRLTDRVSFGMFMEISMKAIGKEIKPMDTENIPTVMEPPTRVTGGMIYNTVEELNIGTITQNTKDSIKKGKNTAWVHTPGKTVLNTQANGMRTGFMVKVNILGMTVDSTVETGRTTTWMGMVFIPGKMEESTRASTKRIRSTDMVCTHGQMAGNMMESGLTADSMARASTYQRLVSIEKAFGKMGSVPDGSTRMTLTSTDQHE